MIKNELIEVCHKVYKKGFVSATDGNISVLNPSGNVLITRSGICKGEVEPDDILEIDSSGRIISGLGKISSENKMHLFAYSNRKDVKAVVHCHPVFATAMVLSGKYINNVFPEVVLTLGDAAVCEYATPSTDEVTNSMQNSIDKNVFLLKNHGAVTFGKTLSEAYYRMEKLEHTCKILFYAQCLGKVEPLDDNQLNHLKSVWNTK